MWPYPSYIKAKLISKAKYNRETGCLEWQAYRNERGYGHVTIYNRNIRTTHKAHKIMLELKLRRPLKWNEESIHICNNPACISTASNHVKSGTHRENTDHAMATGRIVGWKYVNMLKNGSGPKSKTTQQDKGKNNA